MASVAATTSAFAQEAPRAGGAKFQDRVPVQATPLVTATIDASGRVVPVEESPAGPVQRIGEQNDASRPTATDPAAVVDQSLNPCPGAAEISKEDGRRIVTEVASEVGFAPSFVIAVANAESRFRATALSPRGAYGLMQLMPDTAQGYGVNICDPKDNVKGGIAFLRDLQRKYRNPVYILAAYNAGEQKMLKYKGVPPYRETVSYIASIMNDLYQWPAPGTSADVFGLPDNPAALAGAEPEQVAPAKPRKSRSSAARDDSPPEWKSGFVQNFD